MKCCRVECRTPFCPLCGKAVDDPVGDQILTYAKNLMRGAERCHKNRILRVEYSRDDQERERRLRAVSAAERMVGKYAAWIEFIVRAKAALDAAKQDRIGNRSGGGDWN